MRGGVVPAGPGATDATGAAPRVREAMRCTDPRDPKVAAAVSSTVAKTNPTVTGDTGGEVAPRGYRADDDGRGARADLSKHPQSPGGSREVSRASAPEGGMGMGVGDAARAIDGRPLSRLDVDGITFYSHLIDKAALPEGCAELLIMDPGSC